MRVLKTLVASACAFSLIVCGSGTSDGTSSAKNDDAIHIDKETAKSYIQATELTTDNWNSLFEETEEKMLDSFGDETGEVWYSYKAKSQM